MVKAKRSRRRAESSRVSKKTKAFSLDDIEPVALKSRKGIRELSTSKELQDEELFERNFLASLDKKRCLKLLQEVNKLPK